MLLNFQELPDVKMARIIAHWTAGSYTASSLDREHYHFLVDGDSKVVKGKYSIADNVNTKDGKYAAHTLNCNTGSIGVSVCSMAGAVESPFGAGKFPMKKSQFDTLTTVIAELCAKYGIMVTDKTVLSHAEVQKNLGITQRGKWDYTRLAFNPALIGAKACGDYLRAEVSAKLAKL